MCTNQALVDCLECYMDELVDCFEDFVKKSVVAISLAAGLLVAMIAYMLKTVSDRGQPPVTGNPSTSPSRNQNFYDNNVTLVDREVQNQSHAKDGPTMTDPQNYDEKVLRDIGFTCCSKPDCAGRRSSKSINRVSLPSLRMDHKKNSALKLSHSASKVNDTLKSCCSLCCDENCER